MSPHEAEQSTPDQTPSKPSAAWTWGVWLAFLGLILFQPNYQWTDGTRSAPYGSDFLQDWIGGWMVLHGDAANLYNWAHSAALQKDASVVGYERTDDGYYPMVYPPYWYIVASPFAAIPLRWAAVAWLAFVCGVWFFSLRWVARTDTRMGRTLERSPQLALLTIPLLVSLAMGQKSLLIVAALLVAVVLLERRQFVRAGVVIGLLAFKPHFVVLLGLPLALRFGWRFVGGLSLAGVGWAALTAAVDISLFTTYTGVVLDSMSSGYSSHLGYELNESHNWNAFWTLLCGTGTAASLVTRVFSVATVVCTAWIAWRRRGELLTVGEWLVVIVGLILASPHLYTYDLSILLVNAWLCLGLLDEQRERQIGFGVLTWLALSVGSTLVAGDAIPVQWTVAILAGVYLNGLALTLGPLPKAWRLKLGGPAEMEPNIRRFGV